MLILCAFVKVCLGAVFEISNMWFLHCFKSLFGACVWGGRICTSSSCVIFYGFIQVLDSLLTDMRFASVLSESEHNGFTLMFKQCFGVPLGIQCFV